MAGKEAIKTQLRYTQEVEIYLFIFLTSALESDKEFILASPPYHHYSL